MRVVTVFALLVCWTHAESGWSPSSTYIYDIKSRSLTALYELAPQYEGVLMKASLKIQTSNIPGTVIGQILGAQYADVHATLPYGWSSDIPQTSLNWTAIDISNNTFKIIFNKGLVRKLVLKKDLPTWEGNFIRGVISSLQLDLKGENKISQKKFDTNYQADQSNALFTTMEESLIGHCETQYDVSPLPKYVYENKPELSPWVNDSSDRKDLFDVVKVSNFSNCKQHIVYHWGLHDKNNWDAGSSNIGSAIKRSALVRIVIKGTFDNYTILSSVSTSEMITSPFLYKIQKAIVVSRMNVTLRNMTHSEQQSLTFNGTEETTLLFDYENKPVQNIDEIVYNGRTRLNNSRSKRETKWPANSHMYYLRRKRDTETTASTINIVSSTIPTSSDSTTGSSSTTSTMSPSHVTSTTSSSLLQNTSELSTTVSPVPHTTETSTTTTDIAKNMSISSTLRPDKDHSISRNTTDSKDTASISKPTIRPGAIKVNVTKGLEEPLMSPFFSLYTSFKDRPILEPEEVGNTIQNLSEQIGNELVNLNTIIEQLTLTKFCQLACLLANVEYSVLEKVSDIIYEPENSDNIKRRAAWTVFRDAVGQAGTGPALFAIKYWILNRRINNEEASELISILSSTAHVPNQEYIDAVFDIVRDPYIQKQDTLNTSAILTFTNILRQSLVDTWSMKAKYPVHAFGPLGTKNNSKLENNYIPYIEQNLKNAVEMQDTKRIHIYIRALGNIGHPKIFNIFKSYLQNKTQISEFQKVLIVMSLDKAITLYPSEARNFLYTIYINENELYEIRTAAVFQIMRTNPPANILQKMAEFTNYDSSQQVISAVKSAILSLAELDGPENYLLAENAKSAIPFLTSQEFGIQYSHTLFKSKFVKHTGNLGYSQSINYIGSSDSIFPKSLYADFEHFLGGLSTGTENYGFTFSSIKNMSNLLDDFLEYLRDTNTNESISRPKTQKQPNMTTDGKHSEKYTHQENYNPEATILYRFAGTDKFVTFGPKYQSSITKWLREKIQEMREGQNFTYTKLFNTDTFFLTVPDVAGHLMQITYKVPSVLQITSETQLRAKYNEQLSTTHETRHMPHEMHGSGHYRLGYSFQKHANIGFMTLFNGNRYTAGYKEQIIFNVPVAVNASFKSDGQEMELKFSLFPYENKSLQLYSQYSSQPYTRRDNIIDIARKKDVGVTTIIQKSSPKKFTMKLEKYGTLELNFTAERSIKEYFLNQQISEVYDSISAPNFPLIQKAIENCNVILNFTFPSAGSSIDYKIHRYENNSNTEKAHRKASIKPHENVPAGKNDSTIRMDLSFNQNSQPAYRTSLTVLGNKSLRLELIKRSQKKDCKDCKNLSQISIAINSSWGNVPFYNFSDAININPSSMINATLQIGTQPNKPFAVATCYLQRSAQRAKYLMTQPVTHTCKDQMDRGNLLLPACRVALYRAGLLDQHNCTIRSDHLNEENSVYRNIYKTLNQFFYKHMVDRPGTQVGAKNQSSLKVQFASDFNSINISYLSRQREITLQNITIHSLMRPLLEIHPLYTATTRLGQHLYNHQYNPTCVVDKATVNTFDNRTYSIHPGPCWHIMAAITKKPMVYVTEQDILVLIRDGTKRMVIRIAVDGQSVDILPASPNSFSLYANSTDRHYYISKKNAVDIKLTGGNNTVHLQGTMIDKGIVHVSIVDHSLDFIYDGQRVMFSTKNAYRNQTFGLCGTLNGEPADDFDALTQCASKDISILNSRYTIVDTCQGQALEWAKVANNMSCLATKDTIVDVSLPRLLEEKLTSETNCTESSTTCPLKNMIADPRCMTNYVLVLQNEVQTCFSKKSVPRCKDQCLPIGVVQKKVNFHCIATSQISEYFVKSIKSGAKPDFSRKATTKSVITEVPIGCCKKETGK